MSSVGFNGVDAESRRGLLAFRVLALLLSTSLEAPVFEEASIREELLAGVVAD